MGPWRRKCDHELNTAGIRIFRIWELAEFSCESAKSTNSKIKYPIFPLPFCALVTRPPSLLLRHLFKDIFERVFFFLQSEQCEVAVFGE